MRILLSVLMLSACQTEPPACTESEERLAECEGVYIDCAGDAGSRACSYKDLEVVLPGCDCHDGIFGEVCEAGLMDTVEEINAGIVCQ